MDSGQFTRRDTALGGETSQTGRLLPGQGIAQTFQVPSVEFYNQLTRLDDFMAPHG